MSTTESRAAFLALAVPPARNIEAQIGVPAELIIAQAIIESGWGDSAPGNNCFGIKDYRGSSGRQLLSTSEWFTVLELNRFLKLGDSRTATLVVTSPVQPSGRRKYKVQDWFATFPTLAACFQKRAELFQSPRYLPLLTAYKSTRNLETFIRKMSSIYATAPDYADQLLKIIGQKNVQLALLTGPSPEPSDPSENV